MSTFSVRKPIHNIILISIKNLPVMLRRTCSQSWKDLGNNKYRLPRDRLLRTDLLCGDKRTRPI